MPKKKDADRLWLQEDMAIYSDSYEEEEEEEDVPKEVASIEEDSLNKDALNQDAVMQDVLKQDAFNQDALKKDALNQEALKGNPLNQDALKGDALNEEVIKGGALKEEILKVEILKEGVLKGEVHKEEVLKEGGLNKDGLKGESLNKDGLTKGAAKEDSTIKEGVLKSASMHASTNVAVEANAAEIKASITSNKDVGPKDFRATPASDFSGTTTGSSVPASDTMSNISSYNGTPVRSLRSTPAYPDLKVARQKPVSITTDATLSDTFKVSPVFHEAQCRATRAQRFQIPLKDESEVTRRLRRAIRFGNEAAAKKELEDSGFGLPLDDIIKRKYTAVQIREDRVDVSGKTAGRPDGKVPPSRYRK
ncbi:hypothetical protein RUND412_002127 [Rhizina undulata]